MSGLLSHGQHHIRNVISQGPAVESGLVKCSRCAQLIGKGDGAKTATICFPYSLGSATEAAQFAIVSANLPIGPEN